MKNQITFAMAQYKYKCFMYDVFNMSNAEYPSNEKSYNEKGAWILVDCWDNYLAMVMPNGQVKIL